MRKTNTTKSVKYSGGQPSRVGLDFRSSPLNHTSGRAVIKFRESDEKCRKFAREYVRNGFNSTEACRKAGYAVKNRKIAAVSTVPQRAVYHIEEELEIMGEIVKSKDITAEKLVDEIAALAFNLDGEVGAIKVSAKDKLKALDMLAKWLGLYEKDNKQKAADTQVLQIAFVGADKVEDMQKRAEQVSKAKETIWDLSMEQKGKKVKQKILKAASKDGNDSDT